MNKHKIAKDKKESKTMVQFHSRNRTGKAGERLVETLVEEDLGFIYRRLDPPDIGVDGEIETVDKNGSGRGGFLKVQVKTTAQSLRGKRVRVPFDEAHMNYFDALTVPPILAVVSLSDKEIWWKPILHKETYRGPRGGFGIPVDTRVSKLSKASSVALAMIAERSNAMLARYLIEEVEEALDDIDAQEAALNWDFVTVQFWVQTLEFLSSTMRDASVLLKWERRYTDEITDTERRHRGLGDRISERRAWFVETECGDLVETID